MKHLQLFSVLLGFSVLIMGCNVNNKPSEVALDKTEKPTPISDASITETYWKLTHLEGKPIKMSSEQEREIHFLLKEKEGRVTGFAGCNTLNGIYELQDGNRIRFSELGVTMMACPDLAVNEQDVLNVFNLADNYTIHGDTLNLNVGRRAPLAAFEAVYLY